MRRSERLSRGKNISNLFSNLFDIFPGLPDIPARIPIRITVGYKKHANYSFDLSNQSE
jgi:hypothetical protein